MKITIKILGSLSLAIVAVLVIVNIVSSRLFSNIFLENKALTLGDHALRETRESFTDEDLQKKTVDEALREKMKNFTKALEDPSVFRFKIWDKNYRIVYSDLGKYIGTTSDEEAVHIKEANSKSAPVHWLIEEDDENSSESGYGPFIEVIVPLKDSKGNASFTLEIYSATSATLNTIQSAINKTIYLWASAGTFLLIVFFVLINFLLIWPISKLSRAMEIVGQGNLSYEVKSKSKDEVGSLYNNFNSMRVQVKNYVEKLKESDEALKLEKASVEQKVKERTEDLVKAKNEISRGWMQLQEEKARLTSSIEGLSLGFLMIDPNNNIVLKNSAVEQILGLSGENLTMENASGALNGKVTLAQKCKKCFDTKQKIDIENVEYNSKFLRIFLAPIVVLKPKEEVIGVVILIEDVTEAKVIERSKDEFFSIASHELRTPLTSIRGNTSLIKEYFMEKLQDKELAEMIEDIHESSVRLIAIVNDFLDMSRIEQGKMEFKKAEFEVEKVIGEVFEELQNLAAEKGLYLKFGGGILAAAVFADRDKTKEVLINLIGNAIKFTEKGGISVNMNKEGAFLKIHVNDTGKGVPVANQALLFHKFQQAGSSILTRDNTKGTGLGLYISKLMAQGMGGVLGLEKSEEGRGTTFVFTLPLAVPRTNPQVNNKGS